MRIPQPIRRECYEKHNRENNPFHWNFRQNSTTTNKTLEQPSRSKKNSDPRNKLKIHLSAWSVGLNSGWMGHLAWKHTAFFFMQQQTKETAYKNFLPINTHTLLFKS